jgi:hypothetical protein
MVGLYSLTMARLQARIDAAWDELAAAYPDDLEALERSFGLHLRARYPAVRSQHSPGRVEFADRSAGGRLVLDLGEPVRTRRGWGGARLSAWRGDRAVRLPGGLLYLTFARGLRPEWVAAWPGFPPRMAVVNEAFVAHAAAATFGDAAAPDEAGRHP